MKKLKVLSTDAVSSRMPQLYPKATGLIESGQSGLSGIVTSSQLIWTLIHLQNTYTATPRWVIRWVTWCCGLAESALKTDHSASRDYFLNEQLRNPRAAMTCPLSCVTCASVSTDRQALPVRGVEGPFILLMRVHWSLVSNCQIKYHCTWLPQWQFDWIE